MPSRTKDDKNRITGIQATRTAAVEFAIRRGNHPHSLGDTIALGQKRGPLLGKITSDNAAESW